jgi:RimJ/RimL family protein N-acetyltransferase
VESTFRLIQDAELRAGFGMAGQPEWAAHVDYWQRKLAAGVERVFAIERGGEHVGNCGIKPLPGSADCEGWIYRKSAPGQRSGTGELAFRRLLRIAFVELQLPRLYLHVRRDNEAALGLYRKIGFLPAAEPIDPAVWGERTAAMCKLVIAR